MYFDKTYLSTTIFADTFFFSGAHTRLWCRHAQKFFLSFFKKKTEKKKEKKQIGVYSARLVCIQSHFYTISFLFFVLSEKNSNSD